MNKSRQPARARGFTLVELLVVIAIISILIALLLPAVQAAREAARRAKCQNNLKQVALGLLEYEESRGIFPPGSVWDTTVASVDTRDESKLLESWVILILPFIEQQGLADAFVPDTYISDEVNRQPRGAEIPYMLCPSDAYNRVKMNGTSAGSGSDTYDLGDGWARGNYAASAGLFTMSGDIADKHSTTWFNNPTKRGVMAANHSLCMAEIRDGATNTILAAEIRAGLTEYDTRGTWAMAGACASTLYACGDGTDDSGPNAATGNPDDMRNCDKLLAVYDIDTLNYQRMGCYHSANKQQTARSMHEGGVHVALADGTVQWISDFIDLYVWDYLICSADYELVPAGSF